MSTTEKQNIEIPKLSDLDQEILKALGWKMSEQPGDQFPENKFLNNKQTNLSDNKNVIIHPFTTEPPQQLKEQNQFRQPFQFQENVQEFKPKQENFQTQNLENSEQKSNETININPEDKINYIQSKFTGQRFKKHYKLFGNQIEVVFQTLLSSEAEKCKTAAYANQKNSEITDQFLNNFLIYRLSWSLSHVRWNDKIYDIYSFLNVKTKENKIYNNYSEEELCQLRKELLLQIHPISDESIFNLICKAYEEFELLVKNLDTLALDPDFWVATAS
ncbi:MAG: hypothetical protein KatS3mg035_1781 [Bacteroidia bacterium]|nr:MAG: hypothetical protein KatS3mg035_1781 [Bacteroidia bacterium]